MKYTRLLIACCLIIPLHSVETETYEEQLLNGLASADSNVRIRTYEQAKTGTDEQKEILRKILIERNRSPQRLLQVSKSVAHLGETVKCRWSYKSYRGFWSTTKLTAPGTNYTAIRAPVLIKSRRDEGAWGSRTGGGKKRARSRVHQLTYYRLWRTGDEGTFGVIDVPLRYQGISYVEWWNRKEAKTIAIDNDYDLNLTKISDSGSGSKVIVLPKKSDIGASKNGLSLIGKLNEDKNKLLINLQLDKDLLVNAPWTTKAAEAPIWVMILDEHDLLIDTINKHTKQVFLSDKINDTIQLSPDNKESEVLELPLPESYGNTFTIWFGYGPVYHEREGNTERRAQMGTWFGGSLTGDGIKVIRKTTP